MTEPLYLALFIWAVVYFGEFVQESGKSGENARQQTASSPLLNAVSVLQPRASRATTDGFWRSRSVRLPLAPGAARETAGLAPVVGLRKFVLLAAAAPVLWLTYNAIVYRNPLEFANGPYSAKPSNREALRAPSHPGAHDLPVAFSYFLKSAELNVAAGSWQKLWLLLAAGGSSRRLILSCSGVIVAASSALDAGAVLHAFGRLQRRADFRAGMVAVFLYNVRYGLELLPAFAVFAAVTVYFAAHLVRASRLQVWRCDGNPDLRGSSYASIWRAPACFSEAWINSRTRIALESELADFIKALPPDSTMLMYLGDHVGALQQAGIPLRRVINEGNHRPWKQPADLDGLWERALANPAKYVDFVIALDGDPVSSGVQKQDLVSLAVIHVSGQPAATIYRTAPRPGNHCVNCAAPKR